MKVRESAALELSEPQLYDDHELTGLARASSQILADN